MGRPYESDSGDYEVKIIKDVLIWPNPDKNGLHKLVIFSENQVGVSISNEFFLEAGDLADVIIDWQVSHNDEED